MPELLNDLKAEHYGLNALLKIIKEGKMSHEDQRLMLQTTKEKLLTHLQKEDAQLYPFLKEHAQEDAALATKLKLFDENMRRVTSKTLAFYDQYENDWLNEKRFVFIMDLAEVTSLLDQRMQIEEKYLYPEYLARKVKKNHRTNPSVLLRLKTVLGF